MADMLNRYIDLMKYQKGEFFDETCRKFKNIDKENKYLGSNARVIKSRHFESGVVVTSATGMTNFR